MLKIASSVLLCALLLSTKVFAGDITVTDAWARASAGGAGGVGAVFLTIANTGAADRLLSASTPASQVTELHTHMDMNGVMSMRKIEAIEVPAGQTVELKPGGLHIMLLKVVEQLKEGDSLPITLTFEKAGAITASAKVGGVAAMGEHHHMGSQPH